MRLGQLPQEKQTGNNRAGFYLPPGQPRQIHFCHMGPPRPAHSGPQIPSCSCQWNPSMLSIPCETIHSHLECRCSLVVFKCRTLVQDGANPHGLKVDNAEHRGLCLCTHVSGDQGSALVVILKSHRPCFLFFIF